MQTAHLETELLTRLMRKVGFYSWSIPQNVITADEMFAEIYEINDLDRARGVSVEYILSLIVEEDRGRLAERIHDVLLGGPPAVSAYRIVCPSGQTKSLLSIGSCSRDEDGIPAMYSGIVMTAQDTQIEVKDVHLEGHISAAIELAQKSGHALTERYLNSALRSVAKPER